MNGSAKIKLAAPTETPTSSPRNKSSFLSASIPAPALLRALKCEARASSDALRQATLAYASDNWDELWVALSPATSPVNTVSAVNWRQLLVDPIGWTNDGFWLSLYFDSLLKGRGSRAQFEALVNFGGPVCPSSWITSGHTISLLKDWIGARETTLWWLPRNPRKTNAAL